MTKTQKWISILLGLSIVLNLIAGGWKNIFFAAAMLIIVWLSPKEPHLSKQAKFVGFGLVILLMSVGMFFLFQRFRPHF
jgi:hypothetical protein